jgi:hypothetical protein
MMRKITDLLLIAAGVCWGAGASAQTSLLEEHFNYPVNAAIRDYGWYAHSAASTNPLIVTAPGLFWTQTPYRGSGQGLSLAVNNTGSDENKPFSASIDTGTVYTSFLFRAEGVIDSSAEGYFFHYLEYASPATPIYTAIATAHRARTYLVRGDAPATYRIGLTFNSASVPGSQGVDLTAPIDTGTTYLAVLKYEIISGADNDQVSLYLFEDGDSIRTEPTTPTLGPLTGTARDLAAVQGIAWRQYSASQRIRVDGIYSGRTWELLSNNPGTYIAPTEKYNIKAYPNPAVSGKFRIEMPDDQACHIQIFGVNGQIHREWKAQSRYQEVDQLGPGLYTIRVMSIKGQSTQQKIWVR